jgi:hypothetical protein
MEKGNRTGTALFSTLAVLLPSVSISQPRATSKAGLQIILILFEKVFQVTFVGPSTRRFPGMMYLLNHPVQISSISSDYQLSVVHDSR